MTKLETAQQRAAELIDAATAVRENAYAPYSKFKVGAAVLSTSGRIYTGCNVENVAYGSTICAERVAIGNMVASGDTQIAAIAIVTSDASYPCGACLQVISEFAGDESPAIIISGLDKSHSIRPLSEYIPLKFGSFTPES